MHWRWPRFWVDNFRGFNYELTWKERRNLVLGRLEGAGFGWWIVFVAGLGFLTDAYDIFAINTVIPMLGTVYWGGYVPSKYQFAMNVSTLLGSMIGQVLFGILADIYGRRKMYGLELVVTIFASLGFATASPGVNNSMSMIGWLVFWRVVMGAGIGADYPLSAVITAEFAPTRHRARMLAAVFFFQPLGQLLATVMAIIATEGFRKYILQNAAPDSCSISSSGPGIECARTVDRVWRLVSGLGAVPAALAIVSRLTIPESVYWVLDVKNDSNQAMQTRDYWPKQLDSGGQADSDSIRVSTADDLDNIQLAEIPDLRANTTDEESHIQERLAPEFLPRRSSQVQDSATSVNFEDPSPREQSIKDFRSFLFGAEGDWTKGNWTDLFATSLNWMLFDFTYYLLGVNSARLIPNIFKEPLNQAPFSKLIQSEWHTIVANSIGAVLGGAIAIKIMSKFSRKEIQMWCFLALATFFVILGVLYITLLKTNGAAVVVAVYVICQLLFNVGPNTTTFLIPAEAFPTRYRCTCHGISAASGKLGSVLGQIVITTLVDSETDYSDPRAKRVGYLLISFVLVMLLGALVTKSLTPETCNIWGQSRTLEELSFGKAYREELTKEEIREESETVGTRRRIRREIQSK